MNVQELIDQLQLVENKTLEVETEGCDCDGKAASVFVDDGVVMICRPDGVYP